MGISVASIGDGEWWGDKVQSNNLRYLLVCEP